jgi:hypothetical protein
MVSLEVNKNLENKKDKYNPVLDIVRFLAALIIISIHIFPEGSTEATVGINQDVATLIASCLETERTGLVIEAVELVDDFELFAAARQIIRPENKYGSLRGNLEMGERFSIDTVFVNGVVELSNSQTVATFLLVFTLHRADGRFQRIKLSDHNGLLWLV